MRTDKIVHFVCFETSLERGQFIDKWEHFVRSADVDVDVTLQESIKKGVHMYVAQHRCNPGEFQFIFKRGAKLTRSKEIEIKTIQAGGYSIFQETFSGDTKSNECKVFVFFTRPVADINIYKQMAANSKLNIYEAYYENCMYSYILEFLVMEKNVQQLVEHLHEHNTPEPMIYKECFMKTV